ncbi:hypothetical protein [Amycolatopsis sp. BJA-103]|uniref:hypothetical protein n=1 Tax=Amycolatopsis sp. BJA-103 TaxID=1911175 RepID=UPI000CA24CB2|nr:hypothetical protein [Amycolatopsis sp. BJA-103]AUI59585.1 hypothetical protein BKN51_16060 [Amycolatopsis sp. BJA-103]
MARIKPRDIVGKTRRRLVVELIAEIEAIDKKSKAADKDLRELVIARGSALLDLRGIGPSGAARLLADVGDIHRFAGRAGTTPAGRRGGGGRPSCSGSMSLQPAMRITAVPTSRGVSSPLSAR